MRKKPPKHSESDLISDMEIVLKAPLSARTKKWFINSLLWGWSERFGKYQGCSMWSVAAHKHHKRHGHFKTLRHDHSIPRNLIVKRLLSNRQLHNSKKLLSFLRRHCHGVVLTQKEDRLLSKSGYRQKMPKTWNWETPFARYESVGIKLRPCKL